MGTPQEIHNKLPASVRKQEGKEIVIGLHPEHITDSENQELAASTEQRIEYHQR
ncbi:hypothetical protein L3V31_12645 [Vibrio sp. J1-1]|uniref:hypothetical protein n=1 Tax=Vibrio sp. J1-1 TaxID=2912251 RepID=UPI001F3FC0E5|nr:hypothetical protein [Vibrio sp. J1-1]MCF7482576.1 hypothetical protein [Vibrio sp. J1-1]